MQLVGYTKNPLDLKTIEKATESYKAYGRIHHPFKILYWMACETGNAYAIVLLIEENGAYNGHAILNYSELPMGRVNLTCFFLSEGNRGNPWLVYWFYTQIEKLIKDMFAEGRQIRLTVQIDKDDVRWQKHVVEFGRFKREATLKEYVKGKDFYQYYKLIKGTNENISQH